MQNMKDLKIKKQKEKQTVMTVAILVVLILYTMSLLLLMAWGLSTSLKTRSDFYSNKVWIPRGGLGDWAWANYATVWKNFSVPVTSVSGKKGIANIYVLIFNTIIYAGGGALLQALVPCIVAYVVVRFDNVISRILYVVVVVTMIIPIVGNMPATLLFLKQTGMYDTFLGALAMKFNFMGMYFLVFHASFKSIAKEYSEAAMIDGASEFRILLVIILPLVSSALYTVFLIRFIEFWNDYQMALLYLPSHPTLAYGVYYMSVSNKNSLSSEPLRLAACMIVVLPIVVLFVAFRNKIMGNITMGGIKE